MKEGKNRVVRLIIFLLIIPFGDFRIEATNAEIAINDGINKNADKERELTLKFTFPNENLPEKEGLFLWEPTDIERDEDGNIYISDARSNRIFKYDSYGQPIASIGNKGQGPGEFISPVSISVGRKYFYIHDLGNSRIQFFDLYGESVGSCKLFQATTGFATRDDDNLFTCRLFSSNSEATDRLIHLLSMKGVLKNSFGMPLKYEKNYQILNLSKIALGEDSNIYLAFSYVPIIRKYSSNGDLLCEKNIKNEFIAKYEKLNKKYYGQGRYFEILSDLKIMGEKIYILISPHASLIKIFELDNELNIKDIFKYDFDNIRRKNYVRSFVVEKTNEETLFFLLFKSPDEKSVYVFGTK